MAYIKFHEDWRNRPNFSTPITAEAMEHIEEGIRAAAAKADAAVTMPSGGAVGQVLVKTASGLAWADAPTGGGGVSLVEDPPGSGLFVASTALVENPSGSGLFDTGV